MINDLHVTRARQCYFGASPQLNSGLFLFAWAEKQKSHQSAEQESFPDIIVVCNRLQWCARCELTGNKSVKLETPKGCGKGHDPAPPQKPKQVSQQHEPDSTVPT
eukprot:6469233-Amphidinium_carterae.1